MKIQKKSMWQFIKFCIVGASNTIISFVIFTAIVYFGGNYIFANLAGFVISVLNAYYWSNRYVFKEEDGEKRNWWQVLLKTYAAYSWGFIVSTLLLIFWVDVVHISRFMVPLADFFMEQGWGKLDSGKLAEIMASFINLLVTIPMNYVINKYWAYRQKGNSKKDV